MIAQTAEANAAQRTPLQKSSASIASTESTSRSTPVTKRVRPFASNTGKKPERNEP